MSLLNSALNFGLFSVSKKIGPVNIVLDKVFRKEGPSQEEAEALAAANDAARRKRTEETTNLAGWPFRNHAQDLRRTRAIDSVMVIPRMKFTYLVEFRIDQDWLNSGHMITNLQTSSYIDKGLIYIPVKSIDHPQPTFDVETLRSANRYVKVPKKMEYQPATINFQDDVTSMIAALRKEYIHFYHYTGDVGKRIGVNPTANLDVEKAWDEFQYESTYLVNPLGEQNRSRMDEHPSMGLKMRSDCSKHFFKEIVIYDLGAHPDSINAYYFYHPVVTSWTHDSLDYEDRSSPVGIGMEFEYESYYDVIGQNNSKIEGLLFQMFGIAITPSRETNDHAKMIDPAAGDQELSICAAQQPGGTLEPNQPDPVCEEDEQSQTELLEKLQRLEKNRDASGGGFSDPKDQERFEELNEQLKTARDCVKSKADCPPEDTVDATERTIDKAVSEIETDCNQRNEGTHLGFDQAILSNYTDDEIISNTCANAGEGCTNLNNLQNTQANAVQNLQFIIGDINNSIEETQFELNQTPFTDPTRRAQLEQQIASLEQNKVEVQEVLDASVNASGLTSSERTMQQCTASGGTNRAPVSDVAASTGADPIKCRSKVGITATDRAGITSQGNELTGQARDAASAQLQALAEEQTASLQEAAVADNDIEILQNMQQSGGTEGSQELSRTALESLQANGGDIAETIKQREADSKAATTNAESLNQEIGPLAGALNKVGGPTPQPEPEPEPVQRVESQQLIEGERIDAVNARLAAVQLETVAKRDRLILQQMQAGNNDQAEFLSAEPKEALGRGVEIGDVIGAVDQTLESTQKLKDAADEKIAELDAKAKAP